jgi:DNA-binding HxlR family transcriptional regulator
MYQQILYICIVMSLNQRDYVFDPTATAEDDKVAAVVELTSRKWTRPIIEHLLADGPLRYSEFAAGIDGISDKVLSDSLQDLEAYGLISREVIETRPVKMQYSLTETGAALESVIEAVGEWTELYAERVENVLIGEE